MGAAWQSRVPARRGRVASLVGAAPAEIALTSGATEANNLAVTGVALAALAGGDGRRRIVVSSIEHKSVIEPALRLRSLGFAIDFAPATRGGTIDLEGLTDLLRDDTLLVCVMAANNETGVVQPVAAAAAAAHRVGALLHCDAAQAVGKLPIDVLDLDVDYLAISSHKMYGPIGVGGLFVAAGAPAPAPLLVGGSQEQGLRSGTEPAPLVAGLGAAAATASRRMAADREHADALLATFLAELSARQIRFHVNGGREERLPGVASLALKEVDAQSLVNAVSREIMLSTGSACNAGQVTTSHVLEAMHLDLKERRSTLRVMFGRYNFAEEAITAATILAEHATRAGQLVQ